jgi:hypothetical protein
MKSRSFRIERLPECFTQTGNQKQRQVLNYRDKKFIIQKIKAFYIALFEDKIISFSQTNINGHFFSNKLY